MAGFTFDIGNLSDVLKKLETLDAKVQQGVKDEISASALNIQSGAKRLAPVNFGQLSNSIYLKEQKVEKGIVFTVGAKASYAPYVELQVNCKQSSTLPKFSMFNVPAVPYTNINSKITEWQTH